MNWNIRLLWKGFHDTLKSCKVYLHFISGYKISGSNHTVNFYILCLVIISRTTNSEQESTCSHFSCKIQLIIQTELTARINLPKERIMKVKGSWIKASNVYPLHLSVHSLLKVAGHGRLIRKPDQNGGQYWHILEYPFVFKTKIDRTESRWTLRCLQGREPESPASFSFLFFIFWKVFSLRKNSETWEFKDYYRKIQ
jgi:hypothetical protein